MKIKQLISSVLAFAIIFGALVGVMPVLSYAASDLDDTVLTDLTLDGAAIAKAFINQNYLSAEDKINRDPYMVKCDENEQYELYCNRFTGEVYIKDKKSGQVMTSNPYNIGEFDTQTIPAELMSQFNITFTKRDGSELIYGSYEWSASRGQIYFAKIENGIRLSYTVGDTTVRYLVPNGISKERFETLILIPAQEKLVETIKEMVLAKRGTYDEDLQIYENDENLIKNLGKNRFEKIMDHFFGAGLYDPMLEYSSGGDVREAFVKWEGESYNYYKEICNAIAGKTDYLEFSKMKKATIDYFSLFTNYELHDPNTARSEALKQATFDKYPATREQDENGKYFALYALTEGIPNIKKRGLQDTIAKYAPHYTIDMMYEDEEETQLEPEVELNPVFRLALEYRLTDNGVEVTLPANSIFYDETLYTLVDLEVLPYFGADRMDNDGYVFYPDGSGAIIDYAEFAHDNITLFSPIYGQDYSFHATTGANQQSIHMPIYGSTSTKTVYYIDDIFSPGTKHYVTQATKEAGKFVYTAEVREIKVKDENDVETSYYEYYYTTDTGAQIDLPLDSEKGQQYFVKNDGSKVYLTRDKKANLKGYTREVTTIYEDTFSDGFLAIVEDGAPLCELNVEINGLSNNPFAAVFPTFMPLPQDTYDLSEENASADSVLFTVVSKVKYMDNLVIRYVMLTDEAKAQQPASKTDYTASYVGMANVYRDYLTDAATGIIDMMSDEDIKSQLPLYIETFGVMETVEKILTIPVDVKVALTSFEDVQTMYKELSRAGISNVKFRLTGYNKGGASNRYYPSKLKWERKTGGKSGFRDLIEFAATKTAKGLEIYPNFEFQYLRATRLFDGIRWKRDSARTVDNRYAYKMIYSPYTQEMDSMRDGIIIAPTLLSRFYDKVNRKYIKYSKYGDYGISLESVASDLSSSYDEDDMLLRHDAMTSMVDFLAHVSEHYDIMSTGGNIYALQYVDHLLEAPIDSSHFRATSRTIPFFGMVMHGAISYAGGPLNENGNPDYTILRSIESGASLYFLLSYANTHLMKEDFLLNEYYSVNYQIWSKGYRLDDNGNYMHRDDVGNWHSLSYNEELKAYYYELAGEKHYVELTKYVEGGDVYKYYNKLNDAIGDLQNYVIKNHQFISAEREISAEQMVANRKTMQAEFLSILQATVEGQIADYKKSMSAMREFYDYSITAMVKLIVDEEEDYAEQNGQSFNRAEREAFHLASMKGDGDVEYAKYLENLNKYDTSLRAELNNKYLPKLPANSILYSAVTVQGTDADAKAKAVIAALCERKISVRSGQQLAVSISYDDLLAEAMERFGVKATWADITNENHEAYTTYGDMRAFAAELQEKCAAFSQSGVVNPGDETAKFEIVIDELVYTSAYNYITDSAATDKDYKPTIYTIDDGSVVLVSYVHPTTGDMVQFILNYNMFSVIVEIDGVSHTLEAQNYKPLGREG